MGRPKKEKPNRSDGRYEIKICIGERFDGIKIMKSFYSRISKEDAKAKAEQYKIEQAVSEITGMQYQSTDISFDIWAKRVLESLKGTVKDSSYNLTYKNAILNHLIPYFGKRKMSVIKQIDIQEYFNSLQESYTLETMKKHKMALNKIFEFAVQNDIIRKNPCTSSDILPHLKRWGLPLAKASSRFSFDSTNVLSISELTPCVPRF